jgi:hypothetical protein
MSIATGMKARKQQLKERMKKDRETNKRRQEIEAKLSILEKKKHLMASEAKVQQIVHNLNIKPEHTDYNPPYNQKVNKDKKKGAEDKPRSITDIKVAAQRKREVDPPDRSEEDESCDDNNFDESGAESNRNMHTEVMKRSLKLSTKLKSHSPL